LFFDSYSSQLSVNFTSLKALDPTLLSQLKDTLPDRLFEKLNGSLSIDQDRLKFSEYRHLPYPGLLRLRPEPRGDAEKADASYPCARTRDSVP
jgi:hypothetical protein